MFLRKYSDASSTEVGTLLMILPFLAVFTKPFFCALADRHRRYRLYFIVALLLTLVGFGSYTVLPFFPHFIGSHGRLAWWLLVLFTVVGYLAYGVVWSLGDAYAANVAHRTGESFGLIRLWGTVGWGVSGALVGALSPYLELPEMVLGFIVFIVTHVFEIVLLSWWPNGQDFEMGDAMPSHGPEPSISEKPSRPADRATVGGGGEFWARFAPEKPNHAAIVDACKPTTKREPSSGATGELKSGHLSIVRTASNGFQVSASLKLADHANSLGELLKRGPELEAQRERQRERERERELEQERKRISQLQWTIFKLVSARHKSIVKYLLVFVALGTVYNIHWSYFFLHLDRLALEGKGGDFSTLVGMCLVAQAVGETFCFIIAPWVVRKLGRDGAISLNAIAYALRYLGNGYGIPLVSPYVAVVTETLQGINYGIFYYLITDTALHYALTVDEIIPQLIEKALIEPEADLGAVRTSLRATMQGVFSGAFDGLGFGLGSLIAGLVLESHSYEQLWCYTGLAAFVIFLLHGAYEIVNTILRSRFSSSNKIAPLA